MAAPENTVRVSAVSQPHGDKAHHDRVLGGGPNSRLFGPGLYLLVRMAGYVVMTRG